MRAKGCTLTPLRRMLLRGLPKLPVSNAPKDLPKEYSEMTSIGREQCQLVTLVEWKQKRLSIGPKIRNFSPNVNPLTALRISNSS